MWIGLVTIFPGMFDAITGQGVISRAVANGLLQLAYFNPRDYTEDRHRTVDDRPYGGGPGMVMKVEPLARAVEHARRTAAELPGDGDCKVICMSPQGRLLDQACVRELRQFDRLILVAGRYEGIDERFLESHVDLELSIGDYVLSGGELPAMVLIDAMARLVPGVLGHEQSAQFDSFGAGLLDFPQYTRPEEVGGRRVPAVLLSGDHAAIEAWRQQQAVGRTWLKRPELLDRVELSRQQRALLEAFKTALGTSEEAEER